MNKQLALVMAPILAGASSSAAPADLIYDNGPPDGSNGLSNIFDGGIGADRQVADDFRTPVGPGWIVDIVEMNYIWNTIGSAHGFMLASGATDFRVRFYKDDADGGPGQLISDQVSSDFTETPTGNTFFDRAEVIISVDIDGVSLQSNTTYWVSIQPNGIENGFQLTSAAGAGNLNGDQAWVRYLEFGTFWQPSSTVFGEFYDVAFRLDHTQIIPALGALGLLGFVGLVGARRGRR